MEIISKTEFESLVYDREAQILSSNHFGPKVLRTNTQQIIKVFYPSSRFLSNVFFPHAPRFQRSAKRLIAKGILAPEIQELYYCPQNKNYLLIYPEIPGYNFRELTSTENPQQLTQLSFFLADLHHQGIFYRGIHLGNVLATPEHSLALIDIVNVKVKSKALNLKERAKNLAHLIYYRDDQAVFKAYGYDRFLKEYAIAANLASNQEETLRKLILLRSRKNNHLRHCEERSNAAI